MKRSKATGITLVEVLVVLAIIAIVAGLTYPSVRRASEGAKVSASLLRGKQIHMALMLYREDSGGETGTYGEPSTMNLPSNSYLLFWNNRYGLNEEMLKSPCGEIQADEMFAGIYPTVIDDTIFAGYAVKFQEAVPVALDFHCNPANPYIGGVRVTKRAVVTDLSGSAYIRRNKGLVDTWERWIRFDN
jgi:prepilin-type N-terminal cleavage/methylation domain-containing protein